MVIMASSQVKFGFAVVVSTTLITGASYTLWMYKRVIFGALTNPRVNEMTDVNAREILLLGVLAVLVLGMGLYPKPFTDVMHVSVVDLLAHVAQSKLP